MTKKAVPYLMIITKILHLTGKQDSVFVRAAGGGTDAVKISYTTSERSNIGGLFKAFAGRYGNIDTSQI